MLFIEDLVGGFVLDLERVGWVVDDPRFWEPEPDIGDRPPTSEKCQEEEKTKHICIKQLETAADIKESHLHRKTLEL